MAKKTFISKIGHYRGIYSCSTKSLGNLWISPLVNCLYEYEYKYKYENFIVYSVEIAFGFTVERVTWKPYIYANNS